VCETSDVPAPNKAGPQSPRFVRDSRGRGLLVRPSLRAQDCSPSPSPATMKGAWSSCRPRVTSAGLREDEDVVIEVKT
jgi:hypothetical protein